mmetsp:Transcript_20564/g.26564  ORF Transcript_20564/g.26564 Transcript_20564/m.26564 type:complete len:422 (-) Transcript_20564:232-1497(-)
MYVLKKNGKGGIKVADANDESAFSQNTSGLGINPSADPIDSMEAGLSPTFADQKGVRAVQDAGPEGATDFSGTPTQASEQLPTGARFTFEKSYSEEKINRIVQDVGSSDLRIIFKKTLENGLILKCHREDKVKKVKIWLNPQDNSLRYKTVGSKMPHISHSIELTEILCVEKGRRTKNHMLSPKKSDEQRCFSLLWRGGSLDLECPDDDGVEVCQALVRGFKLLQKSEPIDVGNLVEELQDSEEMREEDDNAAALEEIIIVEEDFLDDHAEEVLGFFLQVLIAGHDVYFHKQGKSLKSRLHLDKDTGMLHWKPKRKATGLAHSMGIDQVVGVEEGKVSLGYFNKRGKKAEDCNCFSLLFNGGSVAHFETEEEDVAAGLKQGFKLLSRAGRTGSLERCLENIRAGKIGSLERCFENIRNQEG